MFPAAARAGSRCGKAVPMLQSGHGCPALVGPAAGWQLRSGLVRGQLHHRACHCRVLQHGAGRGSGWAGGRREGAVPVSAAKQAVGVRGCPRQSHSTPTSPGATSSSISARISSPYPGFMGSSSSSCHFLLMALLSRLATVIREPGVRVNPFFQFGSFGDMNPLGQLPYSLPRIFVA